MLNFHNICKNYLLIDRSRQKNGINSATAVAFLVKIARISISRIFLPKPKPGARITADDENFHLINLQGKTGRGTVGDANFSPWAFWFSASVCIRGGLPERKARKDQALGI